ARYHAGGNARRTHEKSEGAGVMFTKALACLEQELVDRLLAEQGRTQGVEEGLITEVCQHGLDELAVRNVGRAQLLRECTCARVRFRRQRECAALFAQLAALWQPIVQMGRHIVTETLCNTTPAAD